MLFDDPRMVWIFVAMTAGLAFLALACNVIESVLEDRRIQRTKPEFDRKVKKLLDRV